VQVGDTFRDANRKVDIHLWVVLSDPIQDPARVLIVSLTTYKPYKEAACLLRPGDHRAVGHETCVAYDLARAIPLADLEEAVRKGLLAPDLPVSSEVLKRMLEGAARSTRIAIEHFELLEEHGLV